MIGDLNLPEHPVKKEKRFEMDSWEERQILKSALPPSASLKDGEEVSRSWPLRSEEIQKYKSIKMLVFIKKKSG